MIIVQSAFDKALLEVYNHEKFRWWKRLEFSLSIEISMRQAKKIEKWLFCLLTFCSYEASLEADLARLVCAIDMVDGALEKSYMGLFKSGIVGWWNICFRDIWWFVSDRSRPLRKVFDNSSNILIEAHRYISQINFEKNFLLWEFRKISYSNTKFFQDMNFFTKSKSDKWRVAQSL